MQPPRFWYRPKGFFSTVLAPLGALYAAATARRLKRGARQRLSVPVICVGNINAGGTGKTPTVIAIAQRLSEQGIAPHVVSRGYGGALHGPLRVSEHHHSAQDVGDEPLLLSAFAPTWIARNRAAGARQAIEAGAEVIILDDGFQNPALHHDLSIVVVDAARGFGNEAVLPAGPLREPVLTGLARADLLLRIGPPKAQARFERIWGTKLSPTTAAPRYQTVQGELHPLQTGMDWAQSKLLAFAGIGHPEKFFATVRSLGAELVKTEALADHQPLSPALMSRLQTEAAALSAQLVTTEKDATRLPPELRAQVLTIPVRLKLTDWTPFEAQLARLTGPKGKTPISAPDA